MNDILKGWKPIDTHCKEYGYNSYKNLDHIAKWHSLICSEEYGFYYKIIDNILFLVRPTCIGYYSLQCYSYPSGDKSKIDTIIKSFLENGISIRSCKMNSKSYYDSDYIYDTNEFIEMKGGEYSKVRNRLKDFINNTDYHYSNEINSDIRDIVYGWSNQTNSTHQIKLYETILNNLNYVTLTTSYYKGIPIGFSVVEHINDKYGVIIQRLINPNIKDIIKEPNFILHYNDCIQNPNKELNIGIAMKKKGMMVAKDKLKPKYKSKMYKVFSSHKVTKDEWFAFKNENDFSNNVLNKFI